MSALPQSKVEECREVWARVAREHGWYIEPFYVQIWTTADGQVMGSVSFDGLEEDVVIIVE